ncbi:DUF1351 domain-containing protein [Lactococcus lactis]|uniref:ATP-dependent Lon protease, bacterial type n=1 Tax=Lactococcus lactis subsp. lactis TaxID=1360 RepID=A0A0B8QND1_LACLL|nr:DUF1351 domain-containing protein [Lactococcus lactis]KST82517.1 Phage protein [Lactococcus lactis subsp. lactis]MBU3886229.1 DUF1351 domain-containing protein [Lactococcus lactis]MCT3119715.1 DUF1351 domain-containing protein [Lactococcus lactis]MDX6024467.1 DUF1351 domain-containing protein [Lactococcus lactis subsp. lactis]PCS17994.1 hypothetical protein RU91_GL001758 [Lactococcus lactis subsp. lactis]
MNEFNVTFEPAKIEVLDREKFEEQINSIAQANSNRLVTVESMADDKKTRAELRKLSKSLNDEKIRIKKEYNQPLTEFEVWFKKAVEVLENAISQIDSGIKEVEAEQKEERKKIVHELLIELTADTEVDSRIFESFVDDWAKSSNFNDTKPKKQLIDSITYVIDGEKQKIAEYKANKDTISNFCFGNNVSDTPYIRMLDSGKSVSEVMSAISEDVLFEKQRKEAEEKRKEAEKQRQAELEKQQQEFETRKLEASFNNAASVSTEIIQSEPEKTKSSPDEEIAEVSGTEIVQKYRAVIEICFSSLEEKNKWKQVMVDNGFGDFKAKEFGKI